MKSVEVVLPENIKTEIKKNVVELKDILKNDQVFAEKIISMICNVESFGTQTVTQEVYTHYTDILTTCSKESKPWPSWLDRLSKVVDLLDHLATGYDVLTYDLLNDSLETCHSLGQLVITEINYQFYPDIHFNTNINLDAMGILPLDIDESFL